MRTFLQRIVANPLPVILLISLAAWGGVFAFRHLPVGLFPGLDVPVVNVIAQYSGTAAEDMEQLVTRLVESRLRTISGIRRVSATTIAGISQITAEFDWGTRLAEARRLVQAALSTAESDLPAGVTLRLENIGTTLQEVVGYVAYGGDPAELLKAVRTSLAARLMGVEGVSRVAVLGGEDPAYIVTLHPAALARQHLTVGDVSDALAKSNRLAAVDFIERGSREYAITGDSRLQGIEDILSVPVVSDGDRSVFVRDIAGVTSGRAPRHYRVHGNGRPAVAFVVSKQPGADTIDVVRGVDGELAALKSLLPAGAQIRKFYDQADIVTEARDGLFHDLALGALLTIAVLFFFLGTFRATLIVAAAIPITLLATLAAMSAFGRSLNVITLSALTLAVGMVVDDAIVVAESVVRHLRAGTERHAACLAGTAEIAGPDISGTLTTVAAFAPLLFLGGIAGLFVRPFGLVVSIALLASLVVSLTFVPMMFGRFGVIGQKAAMGARLLTRIDRWVRYAIRLAASHRRVAIPAALAVLGLGALAAWLGPVRVLPDIDEGALLIEYVMPPGTSLTESDRVGNILEREALSLPDVETVYRRTGSPEGSFLTEGVNRGELTIKLAPRRVRTKTADRIMAELRRRYEKIPGVAYLYHQPTQEKMDESLSGLPAMFGVTIFGDDMTALVSIASQVEKIMAEDSAMKNIINNAGMKSPRVIVRPDPVELARCGITAADVFDAIRAGRRGVPATTIVRERQQVKVLLRTDPPDDASLDWLADLAIPTPSGSPVPLRNVADLRVENVPAALSRLNGQREVTLMAEVGGSIPAAMDRLREKFSNLALPIGYSITFTGQYQVMISTLQDFMLVGAAAVVLIYLIMVMQLRSWRQPLIILVTIPFALVGAVVLLAVTRVGLDVSVGMGALTLVGIAVNNAIVLVDNANRRTASGEAPLDALTAAASVRLRPILMTAATTIFALIPIAVSPAVGSRIFQPFAITVIGGLISSTLATLVMVPTLASRSNWHSK